MESEEEEESEVEEEIEEDEEQDVEGKELDDTSGLITPAVAEGLVTPSGLVSGMPAGMETPDIIELRKRKIESEMENSENQQLYQILHEKKTDKIRRDIMGSTHVYDLSGTSKKKPTGTGVDVALDPIELESIDAQKLSAKYDETVKKQQESLQKEDFSDMVAEHAARQKRKKDTTSSSSSSNKQTNKKYKDFKF